MTAPPVVPGYVPVFASSVRTGNLIYLSGRLANKDGQVWVGKLGGGVTVEEGKRAARGVAIELVDALRAAIGNLDQLRRIVRLGVFVNSTDQFTEAHVVANGASDLLLEVFGDRGAHTRTALGVAQTPFGACVEIDLIAEVADSAEARDRAVRLATEFLTRVWGPTHDLDAIDELMTEDYKIWSGGTLISGRPAFKEWVRQFQTKFGNAHTEILETFANAAGDRVVSRWFNTGVNHGMFGLAPDDRPVSFTGMSIWRVEDGRLAECWVERAAFESYQRLTR